MKRKKRETLFHLTHPSNVESIMTEGIKANEDGEIFVFTNMLVADTIAANQVFIKEYAVIRIYTNNIIVELLPDEVSEFSAGFHRIIKIDRIPPECLKLVVEREETSTIYDPPTEWDIKVEMWACGAKTRTEAHNQAVKRKNQYLEMMQTNGHKVVSPHISPFIFSKQLTEDEVDVLRRKGAQFLVE